MCLLSEISQSIVEIDLGTYLTGGTDDYEAKDVSDKRNIRSKNGEN